MSQVPQPSITWRREDGRAIYRDTALARPSVQQGEYLELQDISREQMGAYLCIASNKIPPSVSKRITLVVEFQPMMYIPNQLIGAPVHTQVTMECTTEASPKVGFNSEESVQYDKYKVSQKNVLLWKNSRNYLQTHPKCKSWGCFGKFKIFAT